MWVKTGKLLLAVVVLVAGCKMKMPWQKDRSPAPDVVATTMPADKAVKVFEEGQALLAELRYQEAGDKFESVVNPLDEAGDQRRAAEALFWFGYCREKLRYHDSASGLYKRLIEKFPDSPAADRGRDRLKGLKH